MRALRLPSLAENVAEATVLRWHVAPGRVLAPGDRMAEFMTEKAVFDYEATAAGTLTHILAPAKSVLPVGAVVALLDADEDEARDARAQNDALLARHAEQTLGGSLRADAAAPPACAEGAAAPPAPPSDAVRATPTARRLAKERGVDLAGLARRHPGVLLKEEHVRAATEA